MESPGGLTEKEVPATSSKEVAQQNIGETFTAVGGSQNMQVENTKSRGLGISVTASDKGVATRSGRVVIPNSRYK